MCSLGHLSGTGVMALFCFERVRRRVASEVFVRDLLWQAGLQLCG